MAQKSVPSSPSQVELRTSVFASEVERLGQVRDGASHEPKLDAFGALEPDRLESRRDRLTHRRVVSGQDHVRTAHPDVQLVLERARCSPEIGRCDEVEDRLRRGRDVPAHRAERLDRASHPHVDRQGAADEQAVGGHRSSQHGPS